MKEISLAVKMPLYSRYGKIQKITTVPLITNRQPKRSASYHTPKLSINPQKELELVRREIYHAESVKKNKEFSLSSSFKSIGRERYKTVYLI